MLAETTTLVSRERLPREWKERRPASHTMSDASAEDIDGLVRDIRRLYCVRGLDLMVRIGRLIVEQIYGGDCEKWRSDGRKNASFRRLTRHPELPFHASQLSRAVSIYILTCRRPEWLRLANLGPSHLQEVLALGEPEQDELIARAETENWSTRRLREEVRARERGIKRRGGPKVLPSFQRCVQQWRERVLARTLLADLDAVARLEPDTARELLAIVRSLCQQSEFLARQLAHRANAADRRDKAAE